MRWDWIKNKFIREETLNLLIHCHNTICLPPSRHIISPLKWTSLYLRQQTYFWQYFSLKKKQSNPKQIKIHLAANVTKLAIHNMQICPICGQMRILKIPDLFHLRPIWPIFVLNLTPLTWRHLRQYTPWRRAPTIGF